MKAYIVTFCYLGSERDPVQDSVWSDENSARVRVDHLLEIGGDIVIPDWEPVAFNHPGYSDEELTD